MDKIEVEILGHNLSGMPTFLAMLTQRGHQITSMQDLLDLFNKVKDKTPKQQLIELPHTTIQRMCYVTVAITGLSTKAVSQLRTHAKRATCISTSTQYSSFEDRPDNYVIPDNLEPADKEQIMEAFDMVNKKYAELIKSGVDKDLAGYLLPQGLRKAFIMHASIDDWNYILQTRLCHRNTKEVQHICKMIYSKIKDIDKVWVSKALPKCSYGPCPEGKFCCGKKYDEGEIYGPTK